MELACPAGVSALKLELELSPLLIKIVELSVEFLNLSVVSSLLNSFISIIKLLELTAFNRYLVFLPGNFHLELLALNINLVSSLSLLRDLLVQGRGHVLKLVLKHGDFLLRLCRLLGEILVSVGKLIVHRLLFQVLFRELGQLFL